MLLNNQEVNKLTDKMMNCRQKSELDNIMKWQQIFTNRLSKATSPSHYRMKNLWKHQLKIIFYENQTKEKVVQKSKDPKGDHEITN